MMLACASGPFVSISDTPVTLSYMCVSRAYNLSCLPHWVVHDVSCTIRYPLDTNSQLHNFVPLFVVPFLLAMAVYPRSSAVVAQAFPLWETWIIVSVVGRLLLDLLILTSQASKHEKFVAWSTKNCGECGNSSELITELRDVRVTSMYYHEV